LGQLLFTLSVKLGCNISSPKDFLEFCAHENEIAVLENYEIMQELAWVVPANAKEADFLSRCNTLHECIQKTKTGFLKKLLSKSGIDVENKKVKKLGCIHLLQIIKNLLDYLLENSENESAWEGASNYCDYGRKNYSISALFINNDLRQFCAHKKSSKSGISIKLLEDLGFDSALVSGGYGHAFDFIFDKVIEAIKGINNSLSAVLATKY